VPKRSAWKRFFAIAMLLTLAFTGSWWGWGEYGRRELEREVVRLRAAGERIYPSDFRAAAPPDEQNAAIDLIAASELLEERAPECDAYATSELVLPLDEREADVIAAAVSTNRAALRLIERAATRPHVYWRRAYQSPVILGHSDVYRVASRLSEFLRRAALYSHHRGDNGEASRRIGQLLFLARVADRDTGINSHAAACKARFAACDAIVQIAPQLRLDESPAWAADTELRLMILELAKDAARRNAFRAWLEAARMENLDALGSIATGDLDPRFLRFAIIPQDEWVRRLCCRVVFRPIAMHDGKLVLNHMNGLIDAAKVARHWPGFQATGAELDIPEAVRQHPLAHLPAFLLAPSYERAVMEHFQADTAAHLAATSLAVRLYAAEHDGRYPSDLIELVPRYLPEVPIDPMTPGRALQFVPDVTDPIIYSVGNDGIDHGGSEARKYPHMTEYSRSILDWSARDLVVHLTPRSRQRDPGVDD
jgi:hypothetical protein